MLFASKQKPGWIIAFLGNPGAKYARTRHNAGFMAADELERELDLKINKIKYHALITTCAIGEETVLVMKPQTYMNLSGEAVGEAARFYKIEPAHIIVVSDEMHLPAGKLRIRQKGSAGGHNGLKSVIAHLGTEAFPRIRIGVGEPGPVQDGDEVVDWVIGSVPPEDMEQIRQASRRAAEAAVCYIKDGAEAAMNRYNR